MNAPLQAFPETAGAPRAFFASSPLECRYGGNSIDGIAVVIERKRVKNISLRVKRDGSAHLSIPARRATLAQGVAFLAAKWEWVKKARARIAAHAGAAMREASAEELARLAALLAELHAAWTAKLDERGVEWKMRRMKTRWGICNWVKRRISYANMLALAPRECVEYVVVHELTHLRAHNHGPAFKALMDVRLPAWRALRRRLKA